jgi:uncharacterized protein YecT (DUF1311 family)
MNCARFVVSRVGQPAVLVTVASLLFIIYGSQSLAAGSAARTTTTTLPPVTYDQSCLLNASTQSALNRCASSELKELQGQLKIAVAALPFPKLVRAAQSSFAIYEKTECTAAAAPNLGGSIYSLEFGTCEIRLTVQRIQELREDAIGVGPN